MRRFLQGMSWGICLGACILVALSSLSYAQEDTANRIADYLSEEGS